jgi:DNA polymerase III delta prime subunit
MNNFLWVEKYRPSKVKDCILPKQLKQIFTKIVEQGELPNMILSGTSGLGKTTIARALCNELDLDVLQINASEESGIDTLRSKIKQFASSVSLHGGKTKVVLLDEADYLNAQSTQPALRAFIEEFSSSCRFILTCNFKNRIIEPLHSRCSVVEFNTNKTVMAGLCGDFLVRLESILKDEKVSYNKKVIAELIMKYAPDWRRVLNECQKFATTGELESDVLVTLNNKKITEVAGYIKDKNFREMRKWVALNSDIDSSAIFRGIYDSMYEYVEPQSIPQAVIILGEYQYKAAFVADKELNTVACLTELMGSTTWK